MFLFQDKNLEEYLISMEYELKEIRNLLTVILALTNENLKNELIEQLVSQIVEDESIKQLILQYIKDGDDNDDC